jgi:AcrR family transcriptional regulator
MKTKEAILVKAKELLNRDGYQQVTIRHIASEMGISHGNLGYHYPSLNDIVLALYNELVGMMDHAVTSTATSSMDLASLKKQLEAIFNTFYAYRFFFLDFVTICRSIPAVRHHYQQLQQQRENQFLSIIHQMIDQGILENRFDDRQYVRFIRTLTIQADFWLSAAHIHYTGTSDKMVTYFVGLFLSLWVPYFSEKGLNEYNRL